MGNLSGAVGPNHRGSGCVGDAKPEDLRSEKFKLLRVRHPISGDVLQVRPKIGSNPGTEVESLPWKHVLTSEVFNEVEQC